MAVVVLVLLSWQPVATGDDGDTPPEALRALLQYQGRLIDPVTGSPVEGITSITFHLYDAIDAETPLWSESKELAVSKGFFATLLGDLNPFPAGLFHGEERWLGIAVGEDPEATPRQLLAPAPYALFALEAATLDGHTPGDFALAAHSHGSDYLSATGPAEIAADSTDPALQVTQTGSGTAIHAEGPQGGLYGAAFAENAKGVTGYAAGPGASAYGVHGIAAGAARAGVQGTANAVTGTVYGVVGQNASVNGGAGVLGSSPFIGVRADTPGKYGVYSESWGNTGYGVYAMAYGENSVGVYGSTSGDGFAARFDGPVSITGHLHVTGQISKGSGSFKIDHPLDPENKYLSHAFVESPDMMNVYNGNATLDENGEAWVDLPDWFEAINRDFRYQLTPIGAPAPGLHIAEEVAENRFKIAGGPAGGKVSWMLTGIRHDPYAEMNRIPVEEDKPELERGSYLHPEAFGLDEELGIDHKKRLEARSDIPEPVATR
jgi:hypothetical protein